MLFGLCLSPKMSRFDIGLMVKLAAINGKKRSTDGGIFQTDAQSLAQRLDRKCETVTTLYYVIGALAVLLVGTGWTCLWYVRTDAKDRRKHYKLTLTSGPDGVLHVYRGKLTDAGREALTVVPGTDDMIADVDIRLSDGAAVVTDLRNRKAR